MRGSASGAFQFVIRGSHAIHANTDLLPTRVMAPLFCGVAVNDIGMGVVLPLLSVYPQHFGAGTKHRYSFAKLVAQFGGMH